MIGVGAIGSLVAGMLADRLGRTIITIASLAVSGLCRAEYTGTALSLQTSLGFLLTLVTIRLIPVLERWVGWDWAFAFLAVGPAVGIGAMYVLRGLPEAKRLAGGRY